MGTFYWSRKKYHFEVKEKKQPFRFFFHLPKNVEKFIYNNKSAIAFHCNVS